MTGKDLYIYLRNREDSWSAGSATMGFRLFYVDGSGTKYDFYGPEATQSLARNQSDFFTINLSSQYATLPTGAKLGLLHMAFKGGQGRQHDGRGRCQAPTAEESPPLPTEVEERGDGLSFGQPQALFQFRLTSTGPGVDVTANGERFLFDAIPEMFKGDYAETPEEARAWLEDTIANRPTDYRRPPELLTRDVGARAIRRQVRTGLGSPHGGVFLNIAAVQAQVVPV